MFVVVSRDVSWTAIWMACLACVLESKFDSNASLPSRTRGYGSCNSVISRKVVVIAVSPNLMDWAVAMVVEMAKNRLMEKVMTKWKMILAAGREMRGKAVDREGKCCGLSKCGVVQQLLWRGMESCEYLFEDSPVLWRCVKTGLDEAIIVAVGVLVEKRKIMGK